MRKRWWCVVTLVAAALATPTALSAPAAASAPRRAPEASPAKKRKSKTHATTTTKAKKPAALPSDACKLLTTEEVAPLVAGTNPGTSANTSPGPNEVMCRWETETTLQDVVVTVTKLPSSVAPAELKISLQAEAKDSGKTVSGLGDYAIVTSSIPANAEAKVLVGHLLLDVEYSSDDPLGNRRQDDVVALAKLAFGRL